MYVQRTYTVANSPYVLLIETNEHSPHSRVIHCLIDNATLMLLVYFYNCIRNAWNKSHVPQLHYDALDNYLFFSLRSETFSLLIRSSIIEEIN